MTDRFANARTRLADERGVGLVELLIAMTILAIGIAAAMAVFASSIVSLQRSGHEGTAITLADRQLETYRTMPYSCFPSSLPGSAPSGCQTFTAGTFPNPYDATHTTSGSESPDHQTYTVTTTLASPGNCGSSSLKQVTVAVTLQGSSTVIGQESSCFSTAGESGDG